MSEVYSFLQNSTPRDLISRRNFAVNIGLVSLLLFTLLIFPGGLSAQTGSTGQISGNVTDQNGAAVPEATITVTQSGTGIKRTVVASADGNYRIANLAIGAYKVVITGLSNSS